MPHLPGWCGAGNYPLIHRFLNAAHAPLVSNHMNGGQEEVPWHCCTLNIKAYFMRNIQYATVIRRCQLLRCCYMWSLSSWRECGEVKTVLFFAAFYRLPRDASFLPGYKDAHAFETHPPDTPPTGNAPHRTRPCQSAWWRRATKSLRDSTQ